VRLDVGQWVAQRDAVSSVQAAGVQDVVILPRVREAEVFRGAHALYGELYRIDKYRK
jgi:hypothetical protein